MNLEKRIVSLVIFLVTLGILLYMSAARDPSQVTECKSSPATRLGLDKCMHPK